MTEQKSLSPRAWAELLLLATIWGGSFLCNRVALAEIGVFTLVALRVTGGMVAMWAYVLARGLAVPRAPRIWAAFLAMGILNNALPFSLIVWGQQHIASGLASILNASTAIFGVLIAALVFADERLTWRKAAGVGLGFLGVATAIGIEAMADLDITSISQLAVIAATLSYAISGVFARAMFRDTSPQVATAGMLTAATLVMLPLALMTEGWPPLNYAPATWGAVAYLAFVAAALAYLLFYRVLAMAGAGNLSLTTLLVAPVAILLGAVTFAEALPANAYAGFALLALGLLIIDGRVLGIFKH